MHHELCYIDAMDEHRIPINIWKQSNTTQHAKAIIHINHGMSEHSTRYAPVAERFVENGYIVIGHDHRGHGQSIQHPDQQGHYADKDGWQKVISDVNQVNQEIHRQYANTPVVILGHSMGSFIVQSYIAQYGDTVDAALLSGSAFNEKMTIKVASLLTWFESHRTSPLGKSNLIHFVSFGSFNRNFNPARTKSDWLSRDPTEVDKYLSDSLCGFLCSNQLWADLLAALMDLTKIETVRAIPNNLPILAFSGELDPLSYNKNKTHGIELLASHLRHGGQQLVDTKIYPKARHEILNETNRHEVIGDLIEWIEARSLSSNTPGNAASL